MTPHWGKKEEKTSRLLEAILQNFQSTPKIVLATEKKRKETEKSYSLKKFGGRGKRQ
jgi:hypothetical protein